MFALLLALIYLCFISLGLPDSLLGSAWPVLHREISVPVSYAGIISMIISLGTVLSSFVSGWVLRKFKAGLTVAISVAMTAIALFGFSISSKFWMLIIWSIPYGLGAGAVDSVLNNYVALHYKSQHMSWLHCMWGVGASISPYIMSFSLIQLENWSSGYLIVSVIQAVLTLIIFLSLPLWKKNSVLDSDGNSDGKIKKFGLTDIFKTPGAISVFITFFCYCAIEVTTSLWASSYLVSFRGIPPEIASGFASFFYIGITIGRFVNGFLSIKFNDTFLIRLGLGIICAGIVIMAIPAHSAFALVGFIVIGLGCAPVYPCIIHMTPSFFGKDKSQAMMGVQIAFAYLGFCIVPPLFGVIADSVTVALLPAFLALLFVLMTIMHETAVVKTKKIIKQ